MMQPATVREVPEPISDFERACRLIKDNLRREKLRNMLWTDGRWAAADVDAIMIRANMLLKSLGRPQFTRKKEWIV